MTAQTKIELTPEAQALLRSLQTLPERMLVAIAAAMDAENQLTIAHIIEERMKGNDGKPFPPEMHILGIRTGHYAQSIRASKATISGTAIESSIGSNVIYAGVHEFGARIEHKARTGTARLRTDAHGNLLRRGNLATFARSGHKRVKEVAYEAGAHTLEIPARAPVTTGIEDRLDDYRSAISEACAAAWKGQS